jgi:hypothetical protein
MPGSSRRFHDVFKRADVPITGVEMEVEVEVDAEIVVEVLSRVRRPWVEFEVMGATKNL